MDLCSSKPVVLLIDDSQDVHALIAARLRSEPLELVMTTSGPDGLKACREKHPDLILVDLDMPGMDGFAVIRALKNDPCTSNVPVIVLSGMNESADKVQAFELGATDYVTKPFDFAELRARVRAGLRLSRLLTLLAERAAVDGLTGLGNRASFDQRWESEVNEHRRYGHPVSLAILDLDHFKKINDTYGHPAGDEVLQEFGRIILNACRTTDVACRFGGEEFALIMPHTAAGDAMIVCERIGQMLREHTFRRHPEHKVTVSIGLTGTQGSIIDLPADKWVEQADAGLYSAKRGGRNRVVTSAFPASVGAAAG